MKSYIIVAALSVLTGGLSAQTSIEDVLRSVEANNKDLQANSQLVQSQKLEAKLDNNLPDPSVSYSHFWGIKKGWDSRASSWLPKALISRPYMSGSIS